MSHTTRLHRDTPVPMQKLPVSGQGCPETTIKFSSGRQLPNPALYLCIVIFTMLSIAAYASPFATAVVDYSPGPGQWVNNPLYNNPTRALGRPYGLTDSYADNTSVVTLGDGGSITLAFDHDVQDDPANPGGYDFIVFSNAIFVGGDPTLRWQEPAFVEISQDGVTWHLILPNSLPSELVGGVDTGQSETVLRNYSEYTPTLELPQMRFPSQPQSRAAEEFYTVPDRQSMEGDADSFGIDPTCGGGDAFDIADAVVESSPGVPELDSGNRTIPAGITWFRYIRMADAVVGDTQGSLGEISAEIDAAADVASAVSVGAARRMPVGSYAVIWGAIVAAVFPGEFWIEQPDRSAGLRVLSTVQVAAGDVVAATGHIGQSEGDTVVADALITVLGSGDAPSPLGLSNRSAGSDIAHGLFVRVWGKCTSKGDGWFTLDDGSCSPIKVIGNSIPDEGEFAVVAGVITRDANGSIVVRTQ